MELQVGEKAPEFELQRQDGGLFRLYDTLKENNVVLYFYPKDNTPGCTKQACEFRDQYEVFREHDAVVVGVSADTLDSHQKFEKQHRLPFILLSDKGNGVRRLFGVSRKFGIVPGRVTFIIDQTGTIQYVFNSLTRPLEHVEKALDVLKELNKKEVQYA